MKPRPFSPAWWAVRVITEAVDASRMGGNNTAKSPCRHYRAMASLQGKQLICRAIVSTFSKADLAVLIAALLEQDLITLSAKPRGQGFILNIRGKAPLPLSAREVQKELGAVA